MKVLREERVNSSARACTVTEQQEGGEFLWNEDGLLHKLEGVSQQEHGAALVEDRLWLEMAEFGINHCDGNVQMGEAAWRRSFWVRTLP